jgi:hypothetical protein
MVTIRFNEYSSYDEYIYTNKKYLHCWATIREKEYGRALELLNAKMRDKTFVNSVSNALGFPVTMEETDWSEYGMPKLDFNDFKKSEQPLSAGKNDLRHLISFHCILSHPIFCTVLYFTLLYSTLLYSLYSTLLYSTLIYSNLLYSTLLYSTLLYYFQIQYLVFTNFVIFTLFLALGIVIAALVVFLVCTWLACFMCFDCKDYSPCRSDRIPEAQDPGQAEAQTTESALPTTPSLVAFSRPSRSILPPSPTPSPNMSTHVPASEPPSVSAYIPTSALPYVIPYTTSQEPSAQATLISPEAAAMYETATAVATMRPL